MFADGHKTRLAVVFTLLCVFCFALAVRLYIIQIQQFKFYQAKAQRNCSSVIRLSPRRGKITDRNGHQLAINVEQYSLYLDKKIENTRAVAKKLSPILKASSSQILSIIKSADGFVWLKRQTSRKVCAAVMALKIDGINFLMEPKRFYPKKELASNLMGFTGTDNNGLGGIEYTFDEYIRGKVNRLVGKKDALGRNIRLADYIYPASTLGASVSLTIDETIQHICEQELEWALGEFDAISGQIVMLDPQSGEVLAMAMRPTFNPNINKYFKTLNYRNCTISDVYEPGSSFKIVTAAAALEEGIIAPDELVDCGPGYLNVSGHVIDDFKAHGKIPFKRVVEVSSNVGIVRIAHILGKKKIYEYAKAFGFGEKTGIRLGGESRGILREPSKWSGTSLGAVPIGQEVAVTTLQMASAVSVIANGGKLMRPYVVGQITAADGKIIRRYQPRMVRKVISAATAEQLKDFLKGAVTDGTGHLAKVPGFQVAGKTGTAQKMDPQNGGYHKDKYIMTFVGFAPADKPIIAVAICLDSPTRKNWAANTAAPLFARVTKRVMAYLEVPIDKDSKAYLKTLAVSNNEPVELPPLAKKAASPVKVAATESWQTMPKVIGLSMRDAFRHLQAYDLNLKFEGSGVAKEQQPKAGTKITPGLMTTVRFTPLWG